MQECIRGCESLIAIAPNRFAVVVAASLGILSVKVAGEIRVELQDDRHPPADYTLHFEGAGDVVGRINGEARIHLQRCRADETLLRYVATATLDGSIIRLGAQLVDWAAQGLADDCFATFNARMHLDAESGKSGK